MISEGQLQKLRHEIFALVEENNTLASSKKIETNELAQSRSITAPR